MFFSAVKDCMYHVSDGYKFTKFYDLTQIPCSFPNHETIYFKYWVFGKQDSHVQFSAKDSTAWEDKTPVYELGKVMNLKFNIEYNLKCSILNF